MAHPVNVESVLPHSPERVGDTVQKIAMLLLCFAVPAAGAEDKAVGQRFERLAFRDLDGKEVRLDTVRGKAATVVVFLSFDCPVSNRYVAPLGELAAAYGARGVAVVGVCPSDEPARNLRRRVEEFKPGFPVVRDPGREAAKALRAECTPEAFLLDADLTLRYRGRIDDGYQARLERKAKVTKRDLEDSLLAVLAGKPVAAPVTRAVGCPIYFAEPKPRTDAATTYHRDVAAVLHKHCAGCHQPDGVGPFALLSYKQARAWASDIKEYTQARKMPPWMPSAGPAFRNERRLTDQDIATLAAWADAGAPEGDPKDAAPPPARNDGWRNGPPDLVLAPEEEFHLGPTGKDLFRCFVAPTGLTAHQWIVGYDVKPGDARVVHHTVHYFDTTGAARGLERKQRAREKPSDVDHGPGYPVAMGVGFVPPPYRTGELPKFGGVGGWAPGQAPQSLPPGAGMFLPKGSDFVVQVHYHRDGKPARDRTRVGLYFAKKPVEQPWQTVVVSGLNPGEFIPAGAARHTARGAVYLHTDALLHNVMPHMHLLGKSIQVTLTPPGGEPRVLVDIPAWDYRWQETYWFNEPIRAAAGSKLEVAGVFDNSPSNPNNPSDPPRRVFVGEETTDEMLYGFLGATSVRTPWEAVRFGEQPPEKEAPAEAAPDFATAMKVLERRVGAWSAETTLKPAAWTPRELTLTGSETAAKALGGRFVEMKGETKPGDGTSAMLATYDEARKEYRLWYFDSTGLATESAGQWDGKTKTLTWTSTAGEVTTVARWRFPSGDVIEWDLETKDGGGKLLLAMRGKLTRKK